MTPAGVAVVAWLVAFPLVWLLVSFVSWRRAPSNRARRWRENPAGVTLMLMLPLGFWAINAASTWRDYQSITTWPKPNAPPSAAASLRKK